MLQLILHIYVFVAWTGSWSSHSGFGAVFFCCLWLVTLGLGLMCAFIAPSPTTSVISLVVRIFCGKEAGRAALNVADAMDLAIHGFGFMLPNLGVAGVALLAYFLFDAGSRLSQSLPYIFPHGGYLFSDATVPIHAYVVLGYLAWTYYCMLDRFELIDGIKASLPAVKEKTAGAMKKSTEWIVHTWKAYSPGALEKCVTILKQIFNQGKAFARLHVELIRHGAMRIGRFGLSEKTDGENSRPQKGALNAAMQCRLDDHLGVLKSLWHECRIFAIFSYSLVGLFTLIKIIW